ncbi:bifunctional methylenetetrahydrofolate dehydrogenase/cyclohydrolase, mitochondrial-like [Gigantopelta aegis]|uniref:bifunctional methylenetetrahydrofolate dehydrogenase/cyclohydrolase, mitochondrial-like n=1 Tax=Gigantopelta aegis TaxID=1735272 RepID=UPI001B8885B9|nr:bifunctional methylenetetrahydrofolate dehydrogenase/cyclohydrolase, mitochondrial-like [Gigantopelta aegis]
MYFSLKVRRMTRLMTFSQMRHFLQTREFYRVSRSSGAEVIDGKVIANLIKQEVKLEVDKIIASGKRPPHVTVVMVGSDPTSIIYVNNKRKAANEIGITCDIIRPPAMVTEDDLLTEIKHLNKMSTVDGIIVQLPLPDHIETRTVCNAVAPHKDVDGFGVINIGRLGVNMPSYIPATPAGVLEIIKRSGIETFGKNAVVVGRSKHVGLPIAMFLQADGMKGSKKGGNATMTICHRFTPPDQLTLFTQQADIVIAAAGIPRLITADMIKEGAAVIDVGITPVRNEKTGKTKLVGDVDFKAVSEKARLITPVPGGVGPCTVAMLLKNTLTAYNREIDFSR